VKVKLHEMVFNNFVTDIRLTLESGKYRTSNNVKVG